MTSFSRRALLLAGAALPAGAAARRPNVVIILADDLGYASLNCYGASKAYVRTPHLDRLAQEGVRFTGASSPSSVCSPTRYGLMTGRYCWRTSLKQGVLGVTSPLHLEPGRPNLASVLKGAGYRTAAIGKWHLGYGSGTADYTAPLTPGPRESGFDEHFGVPANHGDPTDVYVENQGVAGLRSRTAAPFGKSHYGPPHMGLDAPYRVDEEVMDKLTDRAVDWIGRQNRGTPFFLYFTPVAVHEPHTPSRRMRGTSGAGAYGDYLHDLDDSVGRVLRALEDKGVAGNTLVFFTSDNGGDAHRTGGRPEAAAFRAGFLLNGGWRHKKGSIHEGGFRVPLIARWPGRAAPGTTSDAMVSLIDVLPTVAEALGLRLPAGAAEDGISFLPALLGRSAGARRDSMVLHSVYGGFAIRHGPWKYIEGRPNGDPARVPAGWVLECKPQLYHLGDDPGETRDLLAERPQEAARLGRLLREIRERPSGGAPVPPGSPTRRDPA